MPIPVKPGFDASTDQALAEARQCRRALTAVWPLVPFAEVIVAIFKAQFPGADPLAGRRLMSAVQSAAAMQMTLESMGVQVTASIVLNVLALAAEQLDREAGAGPAPEAAGLIAREVTRLRGLDAGGDGRVLNAFELLLSLHGAGGTEDEYAAVLAALTGQ